MAEDTGQEKTEEPTARRLEKAREDGDVPRSKELAMASIMIFAAGFMVIMGDKLIFDLGDVLSNGMQLDRALIFDEKKIAPYFLNVFVQGFLSFSPLFLLAFVVAMISPAFIGGWNFSIKAMMPKFSKLNPIKGLKRMFGLKAVMELFKALMKFCLVGGVGFYVVWTQSDRFLTLGQLSLMQAFFSAGDLLAWSLLYMCLSLVLIAAIDVPFQLHEYFKKLKMSLQDIKDEMKDIEGQPEVKRAIRQKQREMATNRMLEDVADSDVVIVNPSHFSVALSYDREGTGAPILLAKGKDEIALRIRELAEENRIQVLSFPLLARALYYTTELHQEIPEPLYIAVAQILSYVYQVNEMAPGMDIPGMPAPEVPLDYQFDHDGNVMAS